MSRILRDRYFAYDEIHGCDLATGQTVRLDHLSETPEPEGLPPLIEVLRDAREGSPRWIVADARSRPHAAALARRAAADARRCGFIPLLVSLYSRLREALAAELEERTLLLIDHFASNVLAARAALVDAAVQSPRPHVLLTFQSAARARSTCIVREARAAYGPPQFTGESMSLRMSSEVARHIARAARATEFQRVGRHAAAERLLRDVAATLARRHAFAAAANTLIALGRLLLERGRADAADKSFDEAAHLSQLGNQDGAALDARLWQAAARTDAGRLADAESICRALLVTQALSPVRHAWAQATLARVLLWQGRVDEAIQSHLPPPRDAIGDADAIVAISIEATAARLLLAAGDVFQAGQRASALMACTAQMDDPLPRVIGSTAHLRVLAAAGDLDLVESRLRDILELAKCARAPLRAVRARIVWYDALQRAGRVRDAQHQLDALTRMRRAVPPLLRRALEQRARSVARMTTGLVGATVVVAPREQRIAAALVQTAHEEENDDRALQQLLQQVARELSPSRIDLVSADAGPVSTLITCGSGLATEIGARVLEAGILIPADTDNGGHEIGVPVRLGSRLLAALVCRWPLDREPPFHAVEILNLACAVAAPRVESLLAGLRETAQASTSVPELIGNSSAMTEVRLAVERAAKAPFAVLIEGESGVGKELAARAVHQLSARRERRFCDINCAALPDELLESELFGHARGAFTGAVADRPGLFEEGDGGTLFLDELPDLSPRGQAKLLRVLQQHEVRRVGETFARKIDVRLVTAANRDMRLEAAQGRFRTDLLYRLDVIRLRIPPLRERPEDIAVLAQHMWRVSAARVGSNARLTHGVLTALARYHWPGNVRELQNVMAALAVAAPARGRVPAALLPATIAGAAHITSPRLAEARAQFERRCIEAALARAGGNRTRAAADLGLSRQGLLKTIARLGIEVPSCNAPGMREE